MSPEPTSPPNPAVATPESTDPWLRDPRIVAFEHGALDPAAFHHRDHLYVAWCYLKALPLEDALSRYVHALRRLTVALGVPEKFHATVTWTYVILLAEAMRHSPEAAFDEVLARHPALLDHRAGALHSYYDRAQLDAEEARQHFVLPRPR